MEVKVWHHITLKCPPGQPAQPDNFLIVFFKRNTTYLGGNLAIMTTWKTALGQQIATPSGQDVSKDRIWRDFFFLSDSYGCELERANLDFIRLFYHQHQLIPGKGGRNPNQTNLTVIQDLQNKLNGASKFKEDDHLNIQNLRRILFYLTGLIPNAYVSAPGWSVNALGNTSSGVTGYGPKAPCAVLGSMNAGYRITGKRIGVFYVRNEDINEGFHLSYDYTEKTAPEIAMGGNSFHRGNNEYPYRLRFGEVRTCLDNNNVTLRFTNNNENKLLDSYSIELNAWISTVDNRPNRVYPNTRLSGTERPDRIPLNSPIYPKLIELLQLQKTQDKEILSS
ncbi:MAG: hypothetical protein EOM90_18040 [Alphaproteobacteria bacterium]|nr:hypothetical protein [Alphaproteobacteria bacterium]